ncbi:hypothetical protein M413DRAFT_29145 [Hebeloma cylindrosporum]|uniref:Uncharacterized protein n=1 Tax=Hebeloma cylindrosporum TaxID=76867 RepID=A0A0C2YFY9_HEBCY|nr:hypothetical protein M413DRAFT_29145 [Hebeloma cylindrosporum h7]
MFRLSVEEMVRGVREITDLADLPEAWSCRMDLAKKDWEEAATAYRDYGVMIDYLFIIAPPSSGRKSTGCFELDYLRREHVHPGKIHKYNVTRQVAQLCREHFSVMAHAGNM